jgi:hypothetical protein
MGEGTWTEKKPPRKTPSSRDKGTVGSSGGVKRPHSDSSTPSLEKQQPKKKQEHSSADWVVSRSCNNTAPGEICQVMDMASFS